MNEQKISPEHLIRLVKQAVQDIEPEASVILYGSRSRGEATPESDWDFLILLSGPVPERRKDAIRHRLYEIEWTWGEVLSSIICAREDWNSGRYRATPFHEQVERDGVAL
jgi:predicted nucleotidyltransferase